MIEQIFKLASGNNKAVEKVISDENLHYFYLGIQQKRRAARALFQFKRIYDNSTGASSLSA